MRAEVFCENSLGFRRPLPQVLSGGQPWISPEHMRFVFCTLFVQKFCFGFPIEPTVVERSICEADEACLNGATSLKQLLASGTSVEPSGILHYTRIASSDVLRAQGGIEIVSDPRLEPVEIYIDKKCVSIGQNPVKLGTKQYG